MIKKLAIAAIAALTLVSPASPAAVAVPAHHAGHRAPDASERAELREAQRDSGSSYTCHLEWDGPRYPWYEAICARKPKAPVATVAKVNLAVKACTVAVVARRDVSACVSLYLRPAQWSKDGSSYTPQGGALVAECLEQYKGVELHYCLTQPNED